MAKRDDLHNEANAGKGLFATLATGLIMYGAKTIGNNYRKEQIKVEYEKLANEINSLTEQIKEEERAFFLFRDDAKINSLKQMKKLKTEKLNDLLEEYKKL